MHFFYDGLSQPAMVNFNGTLYSYVHNLQGDVVGIVDSAGSLVVEYKYDAWGKPTLVRTLTTAYEALAELNPFRYRGYVFDEETGLYYLRTRYFDSKWIRYVSPDIYYSTGKGIFGCNRYCYCANNPIVAKDSDGDLFMLLTAAVGAAIGAVVGGINAARKGENVLEGAIKGVAIGGAVGLGAGAVAGVVLAGSATASTLAVVTGAKTVGSLVVSQSISAGGLFVLQNLRNFTASITVLGRYPKYIQMAQDLKARLFNYPTNIWNQLTLNQQYRLNMEFLKVAADRGQEILLSANAYSAPRASAFASEINYLLSRGYRIVDEGWRMIR